MVVAAVDGLVLEVLQGVVHPAHVPLQVKAKPAFVSRCGNTWPGGGFLRNGEHARVGSVEGGIGFLEELDCLKVFASAVDVGQPFVAGVIQIEHGSYRVDTQAVDVEFLRPVEGIGHEEVADLVAAEVEDVGAPVCLLAAAWVGVLVQRLAVEAAECPFILGEVGGDPVDDDADAGRVQVIDERAQLVRGAPAGRRSVVARHLVSPGTAEGVLGHGQHFHVGKAVLEQVGDEFLAEAVVVGADLPGTHVQLVDAHRHIEVIVALRHPVVISPREVGLRYYRGRLRRGNGALGQGIGLIDARRILAMYGELIALAFTDARDKDLPDTGGAQATHGELGRVPAAEVTDNGNTFRIRGPHGKSSTGDRTHVGGVGLEVGAEDVPQTLMAALTNEVLVQGPQGGQEVVAIGHLNCGLTRVGNAQAVVGFNRQRRLPDVIADRGHGDGLRRGGELDGFGTGAAGADGSLMPPIKIMGSMVAAGIETFTIGGRDVHNDQIT